MCQITQDGSGVQNRFLFVMGSHFAKLKIFIIKLANEGEKI